MIIVRYLWQRPIPPKAALQTTTAAEFSTAAPELLTSAASGSTLDDVDLGRQVARNLEANFLLTNCGLRPGLHDIPPIYRQAALPKGAPRRGSPTEEVSLF
jgi:hypothetical protein